MTEKLSAAAMGLSRGLLLAGTALLVMSSGVTAQTAPDQLKRGFENPPESARPRVWWHWMNGNITKEGIKLDLEWMHRVGLSCLKPRPRHRKNDPRAMAEWLDRAPLLSKR